MAKRKIDPSMPRPRAVRLAGRPDAATRKRAPRPPFGLGQWSDAQEAAVVVLLELPDDGASAENAVGKLAEQIPAASSLPDGTLVVVLETAERSGGVVSRLLRPASRIPVEVRSTALLVRGYSAIGAGVDPESSEELVWGIA